MPLLEVKDLKKWFPVEQGFFRRKAGHVRAVDGVSFSVEPGETLALVGESGCGKTTVGRTLLRLLEPTSGEAIFDGRKIFETKGQELQKLRQEMQIIFQDPYSSLNPRLPVQQIIGESLRVHGIASGKALDDRVVELLECVGLSASHQERFPHEFSGGQRQRIGIARALALNPRFIVCDEAVSALDVSVQAQVINLLSQLKKDFGLAYLFIAHNLSVVRYIADRVAVMYLGKIVEVAETETLFNDPKHPYTQALLDAVPKPIPGKNRKRKLLTGDVPSATTPPLGCHFHTRCPLAEDRCKVEPEPALLPLEGGRKVSCHLIHSGKEARI